VDTEHRWIIDPIDGTSNFLHGIPHFAISIALEAKDEIVAGLVFNPVTNEMFMAEKGQGAFLNDRRLRVSARTDLADCLIATGIPFRGHGDHDTYLDQLRRLMPTVAGVRRMGSAALDLAYVAAGRYDGYWEIALQPWDLAAGLLLVREAGGYATEFGDNGNPVRSGNVLAANTKIHAPLQKVLSGL
jgi:myo-inositol-1(or 4)-monophosphatase